MPLVEEGWIEHPVTEQVARIYLGEATAQAPDGADVLVLACTHYPLIAPLLRRIVPEGMQIVDSAESTARVVKKMMRSIEVSCKLRATSQELRASERRAGSENGHDTVSSRVRNEVTSRGTAISEWTSPADHRTFRFYVTDSTDKFKRLATRFLGRQVDHVEHVDLGG